MNTSSSSALTRHPEGSVRELWTISFPIILSFLSVNVMYVLDRLILAKYDLRTMNAAVVAGLVFGIFQYGAMGIASIAEIFVGQYNGAKKLDKIGIPVWQMIWFSLLTALIFIPVGLFAGPYLITNPEYQTEGLPFFKTMMLFGPAFPLVVTLMSFFTGRGRVKMVMLVTILGNILNVILDYLLIFGVDNLIPPLGAKGAAIATGSAQVVQALILLGVFLSPHHQKRYGTGTWKWKGPTFWQSMKLGVPNTLSNVLEYAAWSLLAQIVTFAGEIHLTIITISESFVTLFGFAFWGLQKGITAVAANYFGANRNEMINTTVYSGMKIVCGIMLLLIVPMFIYPEHFIEQFLNASESSIMKEELMEYMLISIHWLWLYFLLYGLSWLLSGVLTAAGDTKFMMIINTINSWLFSIAPTYFIVTYFGASPILTGILSAFYALLSTIGFYLRFKSKDWQNHPLSLQT